MTVTLVDGLQVPGRVTAGLLAGLEARVDVPAAGRDPIRVVAPFTGDVIGSVPAAAPEDVAAAVARARSAQAEWSRISMAARCRIFTRFHDLLIDRSDQAMDLVQLEGGKARAPAFEEVFDAIATTRYYVNTAPRLLRRQRRAVSFPGVTTTHEYRHPHGVVGFIVPWNFPFTLGISDAIPALIAGNAAVIKPDEKTPYSTLFSVALLEEAGLPAGLVQVITGEGETVGPPLIDNVDYVMFTGSTAVGRKVAERAGHRLIGVSLELGGKNAALVLADADLDKSIPEISRSVYANGGQLCVAMERIYVEAPILEEFQRRFVEHVSGLSMNTAFDFSSDLSSLITPEHAVAVHAHVEDAVGKGAHLLAGGKPRPDVGPAFYEPTVLTGVDETMDLCRNETFGPVVSIYGVKDVEEGVRLVNDSGLGLNHSVWTGDTRRGVEVASRLQAGGVGVNDGYAAAWSSFDASIGGFKDSGLSRRHGPTGLLKYTEQQTVSVQRLIPAFAPPRGMGYERYVALLKPVLKLLRRLPFYK